MVKEYIKSIVNHTRVDFIILRETEKAVLIKIKYIESPIVNNLLNHYGADIMEPIELWLPKSWIRMSNRNEEDHWVWRQGLMKNLETLAKKRLANSDKIKSRATKINMDEIIPEGVTIH